MSISTVQYIAASEDTGTCCFDGWFLNLTNFRIKLVMVSKAIKNVIYVFTPNMNNMSSIIQNWVFKIKDV